MARKVDGSPRGSAAYHAAMLIKGCCPLDCQDSCAWVAQVDAGRVIRVDGAGDHPFTRGTLCAKVNDYQARTYAPDRLLYPLRRTGAKGSGAFERISWDVALDTIAARFSRIVQEDGPEALLPVHYLGSMGVLQRHALMRLFHVLGASRCHGSICGAAGNAVAAAGHPRGFDPEDIVHSRFVLVWGANLLTTSHHHFHFLKEAKRLHGARLVCIDPRRTMTARACDEHISIRPGTDHALAAAMAHVMLDEGLADLAFARQTAVDLDAFSDSIRPWTPGRAAETSGVPAARIVTLAREFAAARPATIRSGIAPQQTVGGETFVRGLSALAILGGHWQHPGGGLFIEAAPVLHERAAARPDLGPRARSLDLARLGEHLTSTSLTPPVKALIVWTMNPAVDQPNVGLVRAGLARSDLFTVVLEHFMTDTARYADLVLPSTTQLEHFDVQGAWGHHYISANNAAIPPVGEARSHSDIMRLLARRMGLDHPALQESDDEMAASTLPPGVSLGQLCQEGWHKAAPPAPAWGRLTLRLSGDESPSAAPGTDRLQLLAPKSMYFLNSSFGNMPRQRRSMKRPTLEMHHEDAARRGLVHDQEVLVRNAQGTLRAWLHVSDEIHPGVVALPGKWWATPHATSAVVNVLTPSAWSPGGQPAYNDTSVEVVSATAG